MNKIPIPQFDNSPVGQGCRAVCEDIHAGGDGLDAMERLLKIVSRNNRDHNRRAMQAQRTRIAAASGDPLALRKLANENLGKRKR